MSFTPIELNEIRPFVRYVVPMDGLTHTMRLFAFEHRLIFMNKGEAKILVDGKEYTLKENDAMLIRSGIDYRMTSNEGAVSTYIYFDLTMKNQDKKLRVKPVLVIREEELFCNRFLCLDSEPLKVLKITNSANVRDRIQSITKLFSPLNTEFDINALSGMMVTVISRLLQNAKRNLGSSYSAELVSRVLEYVNANYSNQITLADLSEYVNFHQSYISRCIQKELNMSFHQYLLKYRLEQAMQLLMYSNNNISEIADKTGFSNVKHFSTTFKKHYGMSPSKVRK